MAPISTVTFDIGRLSRMLKRRRHCRTGGAAAARLFGSNKATAARHGRRARPQLNADERDDGADFARSLMMH